eukprot:COSAG02_NODE_244_length_27402_cov_41.050397_5_plen_97_part_00
MKLDVLLAAASAGPVAYRLHELDLLGVASASSVEALSSPTFWIAAGCLGMLYVFHASIGTRLFGFTRNAGFRSLPPRRYPCWVLTQYRCAVNPYSE